MIRSAFRTCCALILGLVVAVAAGGSPTASAFFLGGEDETVDAKKKKKGLPLEAARTVEFSTDEGSWLSLDVSPDGATLVFDLLGDLYTLPIQGGTPEKLTSSGLPFEAQPRFSPDGSRIVYTSDQDGGENLWIMNLQDRKERQLTQGKAFRYQSPEWTPDGDYVIASRADLRGGMPKLWMFHQEGGSGVELIKKPDDLKTTGAAFGVDGRYIWHAQRTRDWQYNAIFPQFQLAVYDRETGKTFTRSSRFGSAFSPTLSPDGRWLVFGTRHDAETGLRLRDLTTGDERWLAYPVQRDDQESRGTRDVLPGMSFTPDSKALVASYAGKLWRIDIESGKPSPIPFQVNLRVEMGPEVRFSYPVEDTPGFTVRQIRDSAPSPVSDQLAFTALDRLYLIDLPGGQPRRLTSLDSTEAQPAWSPDGAWICYVTWSPEGGQVYKIAASGGQPIRISSVAAIYQEPAWSPDGERIVLVRGAAQVYKEASGPRAPGASSDLVWIPASGGDATFITPLENRSNPHFRIDVPDRIYLHGGEGLVSIRWDGTDEKEHLKVTGSKVPGSERPPQASLILMAPRGDRALAQVGNDLYVVTVPYVGGDTPSISVADPKKSAFPSRRLTDVGDQFPAWNADGNRVHWSIGNSHLVYDLAAAKEAEAQRAQAEEATESQTKKEAEEEKPEPAYKPQETKILITTQRDVPQGVALLRGGRAITMDGEVLENADIVVRNNRIESIGPRGPVPSGARVLDISGRTVIPGFVDTHAHMRPAWGIHKSQVWTYLANLAYGVTTTRDPQTATTDVLSYGDLVENGTILGPRIYSTGPGVFYNEQIESLEHARTVLKRYSEYYDTKTIKMYVAGNREQRQWILMAAREQELMPTTEGSLDMKLNLTQLIDGYPGHEHSFPIFPLYKDVVELTARAGMAYTPTLLVAYGGPWAENYFYVNESVHDNEKLRRFTPHSEIDQRTRRRGQGTGPGPGGWFMEEEHVFPQLARVVKDVVEAGGRAGVGSHGQLQGLGFHWELWAMQAGGLSPHEALQVATRHGAEAIGLSPDLGTLEAGKLADLVILEKNPLEDIRNTTSIVWVMKNGRLYEGDSLKEVWPRQRELGVLDWHGDEPETQAGVAESGGQ